MTAQAATGTLHCSECGRPEGDDVIDIAPDHGWAAEFTALLSGGEQPHGGLGVTTTADGTRWDTWREPVIGWAVVEHHRGGGCGHQRSIEPVLLAEGRFPITMSQYNDDRDMTGVHTRIIRLGGRSREAVTASP